MQIVDINCLRSFLYRETHKLYISSYRTSVFPFVHKFCFVLASKPFGTGTLLWCKSLWCIFKAVVCTFMINLTDYEISTRHNILLFTPEP